MSGLDFSGLFLYSDLRLWFSKLFDKDSIFHN